MITKKNNKKTTEAKAETANPPTKTRPAAAIAPLPLDPSRLRRSKPREEPEDSLTPAPVSAGPIDKVIELAFNPTREKIREVTVVDRLQGRMFPQLDMVNTLMRYCIEIAVFRQDADQYEKGFKRKRPIPPDCTDDLLYRTAQWQKSVSGKNLDRATDIALAETENRAEDDDMSGQNDPFKD